MTWHIGETQRHEKLERQDAEEIQGDKRDMTDIEWTLTAMFLFRRFVHAQWFCIAFIRKSSGWRWMHLSWPWKNMELRYALCRALHNIGVSNFLLRHEIRSFQNIAKSTSDPSLEYLNFHSINLSFIITQSRQLSTLLTNLLGDRWRIHNRWPS